MAGVRIFVVKQRASKSKRRGSPVSAAKAGKILREGEIGGKSLTKKQKGLFGAIRGGKRLTRIKK